METRWEYNIIPLQHSASDFEMELKQLNNFGHAGWELVQIRAGFAYLKRPMRKAETDLAKTMLDIGRDLTGRSTQQKQKMFRNPLRRSIT